MLLSEVDVNMAAVKLIKTTDRLWTPQLVLAMCKVIEISYIFDISLA